MVNLGKIGIRDRTWFNVVEHGELRVDVGKCGRIWLTKGRWVLMW